jgi:hypothetical protein
MLNINNTQGPILTILCVICNVVCFTVVGSYFKQCMVPKLNDSLVQTGMKTEKNAFGIYDYVHA